MPKLTLLLAFHNHQPQGNFDHVFRQGHDACYRPLLDALAEFPHVRCALHYTGPLLEWLDANQPDYLADLARLVSRGQVEMLGGGFYEPMLAVLPDADAQGQLEMMSSFCHERFGARPRGMWLAERVWEPALAETIARAGLRYTLLDDTHFRYAGHTGRLHGYYVTEKAGHPLALFPIEKDLRYAIPFMPVDQAMGVFDRLLERADGHDAVSTYGDDGEKFGMWPGTADWVWKQGWLRQFFTRLGDSERVATSTFSEVLDRTPPSGRIYLPTASYEEMGEWALPADAQERYHALRHRLEAEGRFEELRPFFRGGVWQGFLAKYPEANLMHKKMIYVSRKLAEAGRDLPEARRELYRGQCNCAYWHGLFGGLYLNYLRHAVYTHLIAADTAADEALARGDGARVEQLDFDTDLRPEVILSNRHLWVGVKPDLGGAMFELDLRSRRFNLTNVLGRHAEGYHVRLREAARQHAAGQHDHGGPRSIHDLAAVKESGLEELLHVDRHLRFGFVDHFLAQDVSLADFARSTYDERGDFVTGAYALRSAGADGSSARVELDRAGQVRDASGRAHGVTVHKTYVLAGSTLMCRYRVALAPDEGDGVEATFAPELSLTLLAGDDDGRYYRAPGRRLESRDARMVSSGALPDTASLALVDAWSGFEVQVGAISPQGAPTIWRFPLETASQSESGFERTYQGSVIAPTWPIRLVPGGPPFETSLTIGIEENSRA